MNKLPPVEDSAKQLQRELRAVRDALGDLAKQLRTVQLHAEQLSALRAADQNAAARLDELEPVLDIDRVSAHVRNAVSRIELCDDPVPHAVVSDVLPADVYRAAIDAIPSPIFFERRSGRQELAVPPPLAPIHSIVTWAFLTDVVKEVLAPALLERFGQPPGRRLTVSRRRIVLRQPGHEGPVARDRPSDALTIVLFLARPDEGEDYGSVVRASTTRPIPFRANAVLAVVGSPAVHEYARIPQTAPPATARYTCEFRFTGANLATNQAS